ncbi:MAG: response regulator [Nitrospirae bacterium]|nr:response regulator [Nitrospirota bacterium]
MMPKILIVDDEPHIRLLLEQTLESLEDDGVEILTSDNGKEALEIITKEVPDIVYLDIMMVGKDGMVGMDGYEVCDTVKKDEKTKCVYIALLTAKGQKVDENKGYECGADTYITKPFDPDDLIRTTKEVLASITMKKGDAKHPVYTQPKMANPGSIDDMVNLLCANYQIEIRHYIEFLLEKQKNEANKSN